MRAYIFEMIHVCLKAGVKAVYQSMITNNIQFILQEICCDHTLTITCNLLVTMSLK
jgi:hypothetical protein